MKQCRELEKLQYFIFIILQIMFKSAEKCMKFWPSKNYKNSWKMFWWWKNWKWKISVYCNPFNNYDDNKKIKTIKATDYEAKWIKYKDLKEYIQGFTINYI